MGKTKACTVVNNRWLRLLRHPNGQNPSWMNMPLPPGVAPASAQTLSLAEQKLREVSSMLKRANKETLTPELQTLWPRRPRRTVLGCVRDTLDEALLAQQPHRTMENLPGYVFGTLSLIYRSFPEPGEGTAHQENIPQAKEALLSTPRRRLLSSRRQR